MNFLNLVCHRLFLVGDQGFVAGGLRPQCLRQFNRQKVLQPPTPLQDQVTLKMQMQSLQVVKDTG